jgi:hypothetical protein
LASAAPSPKRKSLATLSRAALDAEAEAFSRELERDLADAAKRLQQCADR